MNKKLSSEGFKAIRKEMGLTQQQMADWLYVSDARVIRYWESDTYRIPGSVIKCLELAGYLPVDVSD